MRLLYLCLVCTYQATFNPACVWYLDSLLERYPIENPATRLQILQSLDPSVTAPTLKAYASAFRRRWRSNKDAFDRLPEDVVYRLEVEFGISQMISDDRAASIAAEIGTMSEADVFTWFKTRRVTEGLREYGRGIQRRLNLQLEEEILESFRQTPVPIDSSMLEGLELLFDPTLA